MVYFVCLAVNDIVLQVRMPWKVQWFEYWRSRGYSVSMNAKSLVISPVLYHL